MRDAIHGDDVGIRAEHRGSERSNGLPGDFEDRHLAGFTGHVEPAERGIEGQDIRIIGNVEGEVRPGFWKFSQNGQ